MYIGSTTRSFKERWRTHLWELRKGKHRNSHLQNAFDKYGEETLIFSIVEAVDNREEVILLEQSYIDLLKPEYNICSLAGNMYGYRHSDESKKKMSVSKSGKPSPYKGARRSDETKIKQSEARKKFYASGGTNWNAGKTLSQDIKDKLRISHIGNNSALGHRLSEEVKERISKALKGQKQSEETKQKRAESVHKYWERRKGIAS